MFLKEANWIRQNRKKFCPNLRKHALDWYRPIRFVPCFLQKPLKKVIQPFRKVPVIIQTEESCGVLNVSSLADSLGCKVKRDLPIISGFSTKVNVKTLERLAESNQIKKIWHDREVKAVLDTASKAVNSSLLWEDDFTGKNVGIAVIDTGIYDHPDISGRIVGFKDLISGKIDPYDDNGHGTHVAGDIASSGISSNYKYKGPAPEANLIGVKVLSKMGSGSLSVVIQGIQWCIENKDTFGINIINMSLGSQATQSYSQDPVCQAVETAWKAGIVVCVAAGNEGPENRTIASPGIDPLIITVGATDDMNTSTILDDEIAYFSSRGPTIDGLVKPDIVSPGTNIISLRSPGSYLDKQTADSRVGEYYTSLSGTSMATPVCCGVVAQILEANKNLTPDEIKTILTASANTLNLEPNTQGAGVIDAKKAVEKALSTTN